MGAWRGRPAADSEVRAPISVCATLGALLAFGMNETPDFHRSGPPHRPEVREVVDRQREISPRLEKEQMIAGFRGWHERGFIPHRDEPGLTQFVTFRLADSVPAELRDEWESLLGIEDTRERRVQLEAWLDRGHGACHLNNEGVAKVVADALRHSDGERYDLDAWTIMPNHVHVLFTVGSTPMADVVKSWKQFTATQANRILGLSGSFWQADYWDTYMGDPEHEERTIRYIRDNPVKAGLVGEWTAWPWTFVRGSA